MRNKTYKLLKSKVRLLITTLKMAFKKTILSFIDCVFPFIKTIHKEQNIDIIIEAVSRSANIVSPMETLSTIQIFIENNQKGIYMRFGDGDAYLALGLNDMLQKSNKELSIEMLESFSLRGNGILKSLSIHSEAFGFEKEMFIGNHLVSNDLAEKLLKHTFPYFVGHLIYSPISLHYAASYQPLKANSFLKHLKKNTSLFIGNETIPKDKIELLFGKVPHIKTPPQNAYDKINEIETQANAILKNNNTFGVVVVAMGCSGRPLMKRIYQNNYNIFLFDFGSLLDGICGYNSRTWLRKIEIDYNLVLQNL